MQGDIGIRAEEENAAAQHWTYALAAKLIEGSCVVARSQTPRAETSDASDRSLRSVRLPLDSPRRDPAADRVAAPAGIFRHGPVGGGSGGSPRAGALRALPPCRGASGIARCEGASGVARCGRAGRALQTPTKDQQRLASICGNRLPRRGLVRSIDLGLVGASSHPSETEIPRQTMSPTAMRVFLCWTQ